MSVELSAIFSRYVNGFLRTLNTASIDGGGGRGREREGGNYTQSILRTPEREGGGNYTQSILRILRTPGHQHLRICTAC